MGKAQDLVSVFEKNESLGIVCHNNPDPDTLGSALALKYIASEYSISEIDIFYSGTISHQQNRAFVNLFDIDLIDFAQDDLSNYDLIGFVDHSVPGINNEVSSDTSIDIIIDHHTVSDIDARFVDHREEIGASATILTEYFRELEIEMTESIATALLFSIRTETINFLRGVTSEEYNAAKYLHEKINAKLLRRLANPPTSPRTIDAIGDAIENRVVESSCLVSYIGKTTERDALPQAADYLINLEGITIAVVFGIIEDNVQLSARSTNSKQHIGNILREAFDDVGSVGGHDNMAGGQIPLGVFSDLDIKKEEFSNIISGLIIKRIFSNLNISYSKEKYENIVATPDPEEIK